MFVERLLLISRSTAMLSSEQGRHQKELHRPVHSGHEEQCKIFLLAKSMQGCKRWSQHIHEQYQCSIVP